MGLSETNGEWVLFVYGVRIGFIKTKYVEAILKEAGRDPEVATEMERLGVPGWIYIDARIRIGYRDKVGKP